MAFYQALLFRLIVVSAVCHGGRHPVAGGQEGWTKGKREMVEGVDTGDLHEYVLK